MESVSQGELPGFSGAVKSYPGYGAGTLPGAKLNLSTQEFVMDTEGNSYTCFEYIRKIQQDRKNSDHYDRSFMPDEYSIIVYDYRDQGRIPKTYASQAKPI